MADLDSSSDTIDLEMTHNGPTTTSHHQPLRRPFQDVSNTYQQSQTPATSYFKSTSPSTTSSTSTYEGAIKNNYASSHQLILPLSSLIPYAQTMSHHQPPIQPPTSQTTPGVSRLPPFPSSSSFTKKQKFDAHFCTNSTMNDDSQESQLQPNKYARPMPTSTPPTAMTSAIGGTFFPPTLSSFQHPTSFNHSTATSFMDYRSLDEDDEPLSQPERQTIGSRTTNTSPCLPEAIPEQIRLNVGGVIFQTTLQTLLTESGSYFCSRFSGRFQEQPSPFDHSYFIDRDGTYFRHILNWLRDRVLFLTDYDVLQQLQKEAEYYQLHALSKYLADKISEINISRIKFENSSENKENVTPSLQSISPFTQTPLYNRNLPPQIKHRNLSATHNWGHGGMGGAGATSVTTTIVQPLPILPARTNSCPSMVGNDGSSSSSVSPFHHLLPAPMTPQPTTIMQPTSTPVIHHRQDSLINHTGVGSGTVDIEVDVDHSVMDQQQTHVVEQQPFVFSLQEDF